MGHFDTQRSSSQAALRLFTVFHLNLMYSSIEESQHEEVVRNCYWPLLKLIDSEGLPLGVEATGLTLELIRRSDPTWVETLRELVQQGRCEFVGSGYAQIIGPLVSSTVNAANLRFGMEVYERLLGGKPSLALVNEQAYSAGLVPLYLQAGYKGIIMEWDNPARCHKEWPADWRYFPQRAVGLNGEDIALIWNKSIAFQKFQRYAHGEMDMDEYLKYLGEHVGTSPRAFSLYGNDAEIFDFRPGRYQTEAARREEGEWNRITQLLHAIKSDPRFKVVPPSQVLELAGVSGAGNRLTLESPEQPSPVKKQGKYNLTRWAVTGRDDLGINTSCWRIAQALKPSNAGDEDWRELCYLYSSDFRTHITEKRWLEYTRRLSAVESRLGIKDPTEQEATLRALRGTNDLPRDVTVMRDGRFLDVTAGVVRVRWNCRRGLAVDGLWFHDLSSDPLCGTLPHGFYDDIGMGADFYTGHVVMEMPAQAKVTDLEAVEPDVEWQAGERVLLVRGTVPTRLGDVVKEYRLDVDHQTLSIDYQLKWSRTPPGSLRLGFITLHPAAFDRTSLFYRTHNGGEAPETFILDGHTVNHGQADSFLVSASHGMGLTEGVVELGDAKRRLVVQVDKSKSCLLGMMTYRPVGGSYFCRLMFSAREMDETSVHDTTGRAARESKLSARVTISAARVG